MDPEKVELKASDVGVLDIAKIGDVPQGPVKSTVTVKANLTIRKYADGSVARLHHDTPEKAQEYADSVLAQEGGA